MKKIIAGKRYDTETAIRIADWEHGESGNFHHVYEALFKTQSGAWFLEYHGGALSRYAESTGPHTCSGSSGIRLLDIDEALAWCETHDVDADIIEQHFIVEDA